MGRSNALSRLIVGHVKKLGVGGGVIQISSDGAWSNVISVTRGCVDVKLQKKKLYITLEWPPSVRHVCCRLQQVLMQLQQSQLDTLSEWLSKMEERIALDEPAASDINILRKQVDTHKVRHWLLLGQSVRQGV